MVIILYLHYAPKPWSFKKISININYYFSFIDLKFKKYIKKLTKALMTELQGKQ